MHDNKATSNEAFRYITYDSTISFPVLEQQILSYWNEKQVFNYSIESRPVTTSFIFYDGPPFANGLPHYGHLLTGFVKDAIGRFQTIKGKRVERKFGWDCHGLPAEMGAEKELKIAGRLAIIDYGIEKFNNYCRTSVMHYAEEWKHYVDRQGRWVDMHNAYKTMDTSFMETVLWVFKSLYEKGLIYQSLRVMPYSWACETPLSHFETRLDNSYRERADKAVTVAFTLTEKPHFIEENCDAYKIIAWTTTPWTLPSNLALAVGENIDYGYHIKDNICYIMAKTALKNYSKECKELENTSSFKGKLLENCTYIPLFPYFKDHKNGFRILIGSFVLDNEGTGCVHLAPGFGEDDQLICQEKNIEIVCPIDTRGCFTSEVKDFAQMLIWDAIDPIIIYLKETQAWIRTEQYLHNYPHCWRTDTPLIYKAVPSWYVKVTAIRERMVELNQQVEWIPHHIKDGLFGNWLANARDWSISRNRFFGTPIPIWMSDDPAYPRIEVYGSIEELEKAFNTEVKDLHRPYIDELTRPNPDDPSGKSMMRRVEDVFDCWFESGSVPYGLVHYPFKHKEDFYARCPSDFVVEYTAQTRGWFYTLFVLSTALFDKPPFKNAICHGVVLDEQGQKLSKRLQNYADPMDLFEQFGADALRFLMLSSQVMHGGELRIDKEGHMVRDVLRLVIKPLWNAWHFFSLYANVDKVKAELTTEGYNLMDRYILAKCNDAVTLIDKSLTQYMLPQACQAVAQFLEILNNWYIRRNRSRFWRAEYNQDKVEAYNVLYSVLHLFCRAASPLLPFITESIFLGLQGKECDKASAENSVHVHYYPESADYLQEQRLIELMDEVRDICNIALSLRHKYNLRVRLPLAKITLFYADPFAELETFFDIIQEEINVKTIEIKTDINSYASHHLQLHFPVIGKRLPHKMKDFIKALKEQNWKQLPNGAIVLEDEVLKEEEYSLTLNPKNIEGLETLSSHKGLILLDMELNEALLNEGMARDMVRAIQQARKEANLAVSNRITLFFKKSSTIEALLETHFNYIAEQTLATSYILKDSLKECKFMTFFENGEAKKIEIGFNLI